MERVGDGSQVQKPAFMSWRLSTGVPRKFKKPVAWGPRLEKGHHSQTLDGDTREAKAAEKASIVIPQAPPRIREITTALDPFCRFPYPLSREDQSLLHCYLVQVPAHIYGTRADAVFSSVRDGSFPMSVSSTWTLQWMLIAANGIFANQVNPSDLQKSLLHRKNQAYQALNGSLRRNSGIVPDGLLGGIIMAAITESRLSNPVVSRIHFSGFQAAIQTRGGLKKSLLGCSSASLKIAHLMPYLACEPPPPRLTADGKPDATQQVRDFIEFLAVEMPEPGQPESLTGHPEERGTPMPFIGSVFTLGVLASYVQPTESRLTRYIDESSYFLSLYLINFTLRRVAKSAEDAALFTALLVAVLHQSSASDPKTGTLLLTVQGFLWVTFKAVWDYQKGRRESDDGTDTQLILDASMALMAFRRMPSKSARKQVLLVLYFALSGQSV